MSVIDIKVPNIGDFKDVEIIEILVKIGQEITKGDSIITLESDKSSVEVPSDHSGKISNINVKVGDKVSEGDLILKIELFQKENIQKDIKQINDTKEIQQPIEKPLEKKEIKTNILNIDKTDKLVLASPRVRKFARELGADINIIPGSEKFGRVSEDDIKIFVKHGINQKQPLENNVENRKKQIKIEYDHSDFGEIDIKDIPIFDLDELLLPFWEKFFIDIKFPIEKLPPFPEPIPPCPVPFTYDQLLAAAQLGEDVDATQPLMGFQVTTMNPGHLVYTIESPAMLQTEFFKKMRLNPRI